MLEPMEYVVLALATYRFTRLFVTDEVLGRFPSTVHPRGTFIRHLIDVALYDDKGKDRNRFSAWLSDLYSCAFCTGVWVSILVWFAWTETSWAQVPLEIAAVAGAQAFVASRPEA